MLSMWTGARQLILVVNIRGQRMQMEILPHWYCLANNISGINGSLFLTAQYHWKDLMVELPYVLWHFVCAQHHPLSNGLRLAMIYALSSLLLASFHFYVLIKAWLSAFIVFEKFTWVQDFLQKASDLSTNPECFDAQAFENEDIKRYEVARHAKFWTDEGAKTHYKNHVRAILNRKNYLNG